MSTSHPKKLLILPQPLWDAIEEYRYKHDFPNMSAAIRWLITWALNQAPIPPDQRAKPDPDEWIGPLP